MKKGLSLLLSLLMVISMFSCLSVVASAASDYQLDTWYTVADRDEGTFVVPESGYYKFASDRNSDSEIFLSDSNGDDVESFYGFCGSVYLEKDEVISCYFIDWNGSGIRFKITKIENNVASIELILADNTIYLESNGDWSDRWDEALDQWIDFYYYYYGAEMQGNILRVTYNDGAVVDYTYSGTEWRAEDGRVLDNSLFADLTDQETAPWYPDTENYVTVSYFGEVASARVYVVENPIESISFTPARPYEYVEYSEDDGYWTECWYHDSDECSAYFHYYAFVDPYSPGNALTVNYTDGRSVEYICTISGYDEMYDEPLFEWISESGEVLDTSKSYVAGSSDQWKKHWYYGEDCYFTIIYNGRMCNVPVSVIKNPVESIEFIPANGSLSIFENTNGHWDDYWDDEADCWIDYYYYNVYQLLESGNNAIKVNYTNGSSSTYYYSGFENAWINEYDDVLDNKYLEYNAYQDDGNYWTVGGDNVITIEYYGKTVDVNVNIMEAIPDVTDGTFTAEVISLTECVIYDVSYDAVVNGVLTIPEAIQGYKVVGIESGALYGFDEIKAVNLPSSFNSIGSYTFGSCDNLTKVNVAAGNSDFASRNGVVYNKAMTEIVYCPPCFNGDLYIPAEVEEIDGSILAAMGNASSITIDENNPNFAIENGIVYNADFTKIVKALSLPENYVMKSTVTEIGKYAFSGNTTVKTATINNTVTKITYGAFSGCSALESVALPEGLVDIDYASFKNSGLKSINLPSTVKYISSLAFNGCGNLASVSLNEGLEYICDCAFENSGVTSIIIPDSVVEVEYKAFYNCDSLTNVVIGSGVSDIGGYVFGYCGSLKELNVPATVVSVYESSIRGCSRLERINVDANNPNYSSIDGVLFNKNASRLYVYPDGKAGAYTIPSTVNYISSEAFDSASITSVVIPDSVISLGSEAFINCTSLSQVVLSENLTEIDYCTFERCSSLTEINIPASVTYIDGRAFIYCTALKAINVAEANTEYTSENGILYNKNKTTLVLAPYGIEGEVVVPQGTLTISSFANCKKITSVVLPDGVTEIYGAAFSACTSLTEINLPESVTYIAYMAFGGCSSLKSIKLPSSITKIAWSTFEYCENLEAIEIPASVTLIEEDAFWNCTSLKDVYYTGTEEQWNAIEIEYGNECLTNATIHFNSFMPDDYVANTEPTLNCVDGVWYYMKGNSVITDYTGLVEFCGSFYYVANGVLDWGFTGLVEYCGGFFHVQKGCLDWSYTGLSNYYGDWFYVTNGVLDRSYTGLTEFCGTFYHVQNGFLDWSYTGLSNYYGDWFYVTNAVLDRSYTGLTEFCGTFYHVQNGYLDWSYSGLSNYYGEWFYVTNGVLDRSYTGLVNYGGTWYHVVNGYLDWSYTGLTNYGGTWYYVENGVLNWNSNTLVNYYGEWFYTVGGTIAWDYTGLVNYGGVWYHVVNGYLDWSYTGLTNYGGTWYYVENGALNWNSNTLVNYYGEWFYTVGGTIAWGYTGWVNYYGGWYYITNGYLDWSRQ